MILGTGSYRAGYRASEFRPKIDAGLGWFKGEGDPQAVRTYYLDLQRHGADRRPRPGHARGGRGAVRVRARRGQHRG